MHKLTYNRTNHENMHVHGYREKGNINTPLELAIINEVDRYHARDRRDRPRAALCAASARMRRNGCKEQIIESMRYAHAEGIDRDEIREWTWKD